MTSPGLPSSRAGSPARASSSGPQRREPTNPFEDPGERTSSFVVGPDEENGSSDESPSDDDSDAEAPVEEPTVIQPQFRNAQGTRLQQAEPSSSRQTHIQNENTRPRNTGRGELRRSKSDDFRPSRPIPTTAPTAPPMIYAPGTMSRIQSGTRIDEADTPHVRLQLPAKSTSHEPQSSNNQSGLRQRRGSRVGDVHRSNSRMAAEKLVQQHKRRLSKSLPPVPPTPDAPPMIRTGGITPQGGAAEVVTPITSPAGQEGEGYFQYAEASRDSDDEESDERPRRFLAGILPALLQLQSRNNGNSGGNSSNGTPSGANTPAPSAPPSPSMAPTRPQRPAFITRASDSITQLFDRSSSFTNVHLAGSTAAPTPNASFTNIIPNKIRQLNLNKRERKQQPDTEEKKKRRNDREVALITNHIATVISRHRYLTCLCRALMQSGAPTHRLEDTLLMSARALAIDCQVLYIPGCMIISFDDKSTHTAEVKLVREAQGAVDLGRLSDIHAISKSVVHDRVGADCAAEMLEAVMARENKFGAWPRVLVAGLAAASVTPVAFSARWVDVPISFLLGCFVGYLAFILAPRSKEYQHVFEVTAAVITSFLARMLGSVQGGQLFCFSALAQSPMVLLLPGYTILCASLELQTGSIIAGSVRLVYAMIYTLCLGYGITIGSTLYGTMDRNATSETICAKPMNPDWLHLFVPLLTMSLCMLSQAKWKQVPVMTIISYTGFWAAFYARQYFKNAQIASSLGALCVGILTNALSRAGPQIERLHLKYAEGRLPGQRWLKKRSKKDREPFYQLDCFSATAAEGDKEGRVNISAIQGREEGDETDETDKKESSVGDWIGSGMAAALMIPAIYVQVPGGLAVTGSLLDGIAVANQLTGNTTTPQVNTPAESLVDLTNPATSGVAFTVLFRVIQVSIGITVGLFMSALLVYPFGKRRSALFSF